MTATLVAAPPDPNNIRVAGKLIAPVFKTREALEAEANRVVSTREAVYVAFPGADVRVAELSQEGKPGAISAVINTNDVDRYQTIIDPRGGDFSSYLENPILLWQHGLDRNIGSWPVGRVLKIDVGDSEVAVELEFDTEGELGAEMDRLYRQKWLRGFSIGFIPISYAIEQIEERAIIRYTAWELAETSCVAVPGNPFALSRALEVGEVLVEHQELRKYVEEAVRNAAPPSQLADGQPPSTLAVASKPVVPSETIVDTRAAAVTNPSQTQPAQQPLPAVENTFPVEWNADWRLADECLAATPEQRRAMAAISEVRGSSEHAHFVHHHADGRVSWRALAECMAELLTQPSDLTLEQKDAAYEHLAEHYRALDIVPPEPGAKTPDQAYDLALEGRVALLDSAGYSWLFVEPVESAGRTVPGFQRVDDAKALRLGGVPAVGRLTDHRQWGQRSVGTPNRDETLLEQLATTQRHLAGLLEQRAGAEFSQKNRTQIMNACDSVEQLLSDVESRSAAIRTSIAGLRSMVEKPSGSESGDSGSERSAGGRTEPTGQSQGAGTGFQRPL